MLLGIPIYFALYHSERLLSIAPTSPTVTVYNCWTLNIFLTVLPVTASVLFFWRLLRRRNKVDYRWAFLLTASLYFGTLILPFSTQLWGHATAAAFWAIAVALFARQRPVQMVLAGFVIGLAVLCDIAVSFTVPALLTVLLARRKLQLAGWFLAGGLLPFCALLAYNQICFGEYLTLASFHSAPGFIDENAVGGLFGPASFAEAAWGISFSPYHGLFWFMPVCLAALGLGVASVIRRQWNWLHIVCLSVFGAVFIMNLLFNGWHGGDSSGPRYLISVLPAIVLLAALPASTPWFARHRLALTVIVVVTALLSMANMAVITSVTPQAMQYHRGRRTTWRNPLMNMYGILLRDHRVHIAGYDMVRRDSDITDLPYDARAFNVGTLAGISGAASVIPGVVIIAVLLFMGWRRLPPENTDPESPVSTPEQSVA